MSIDRDPDRRLELSRPFAALAPSKHTFRAGDFRGGDGRRAESAEQRKHGEQGRKARRNPKQLRLLNC
jgi:hypothetical protein